jgi:hypothetical protein
MQKDVPSIETGIAQQGGKSGRIPHSFFCLDEINHSNFAKDYVSLAFLLFS